MLSVYVMLCQVRMHVCMHARMLSCVSRLCMSVWYVCMIFYGCALWLYVYVMYVCMLCVYVRCAMRVCTLGMYSMYECYVCTYGVQVCMLCAYVHCGLHLCRLCM